MNVFGYLLIFVAGGTFGAILVAIVSMAHGDDSDLMLMVKELDQQLRDAEESEETLIASLENLEEAYDIMLASIKSHHNATLEAVGTLKPLLSNSEGTDCAKSCT